MPKNYDYEKTIKLKHHERPAIIDTSTGEIIEVEDKTSIRSNNIPDGKSKLDYKEFGILNLDLTRKLKKYFNETEIYVIFEMINRTEFNTNSLKPLNNDLSIRTLSEEFNVNRSKLPKVLKRLFDMGVYAQLKISENSETKEYWILNPYIFWRGRLKNDSCFEYFKNTDITKLLS
jgi:hypothetical protein